MTAISITRAGGPEVLQPVIRPMPQPKAGEVLIKVAYAGVNRRDCEQRSKFAPFETTDVPGLEVAGEVVATGAGVSRWKLGELVCALVNGGGYAQYCIAAEQVTLPIPEAFDLRMAAALPEVLFTAWLSVFMVGDLKPGEWLLVHGGSGGVGMMAIQLARLLGAKVVATAGSVDKCDACVELGATIAINYREQDFVSGVLRATEECGADVILDMVGAAYAKRNLAALAIDGRLVHISRADTAPFCASIDDIMSKRARVTGCRLRISPLSLKAEIVRQVKERVWRYLGTRVTVIIDSVTPLAQASVAHLRMESSAHIGKIILEVSH